MGKLKIRIMNIVYLAISGFAIFWYSLNFLAPNKAPFLKFALSAEITEEASETLLDDETLSSLGISSRHDLFEEGNIDLSIEIQVKNRMLFDVWKSDDPATTVDEYFIQPNIDELIKQIQPTFNRIAKGAAKGVVKDMIEEQLKDGLGGEDLYAQLAGSSAFAGKDAATVEAELAADVSSVIDVFMGENATLDSVSEVISDKMDKYFEALGETPMTTEETKELLKDNLSGLGLVDDEGNITSIEDAIAALLGGMLGGENPGKGGEPAQIKLRKLLNPKFQGEGEKPEQENAIATKLKEIVNEKLDAETKKTIATGFKIIGIVWAVFVLGWALKLFQVIIGFVSNKPYVRFEIVGAIANLVQFILAVISFVILAMFKFGGIEKLMGIEAVKGFLDAVPVPLGSIKNLELTFSAMIPGALALVDAIYGIFYGIAKRKFKREYKEQNA